MKAIRSTAFFTYICLALVTAITLLPSSSAHSQDGINCVKSPENPHQSKFEPEFVKVKMGYVCEPTTTPITLTLTLELQKRSGLVFWTTVGSSGPQSRPVGVDGARWNKNTLSAKGLCVDGVYRARLIRQAFSSSGVAIGGGTDNFTPVPVACNKSVGMIIDDTGSMGGEINAVKAALNNYIQSRNEEELTVWNLTSFKDSVNNFGTTTENSVISSWVSSLSASGGGDCPENALGAISSSITTLQGDPNEAKTLIVATDASTQGGDVDGIIANAQASGIRVNVLLTGDCGNPTPSGGSASLEMGTKSGIELAIDRVFSVFNPIQPVKADFIPGPLSSQLVLRRIADETGGRYFYLPGGTQADFEMALDEIFLSVDDPAVVDNTPPSIDVSVSPSIVWPPNHKMIELDLSVSAFDDSGESPLIELVGVTSTEPADGQGDGSTESDIDITEENRVFVRAERSGTGNMRIYTITYKATDAAGNFAFGTADVVVPHNRAGSRSK